MFGDDNGCTIRGKMRKVATICAFFFVQTEHVFLSDARWLVLVDSLIIEDDDSG